MKQSTSSIRSTRQVTLTRLPERKTSFRWVVVTVIASMLLGITTSSAAPQIGSEPFQLGLRLHLLTDVLSEWPSSREAEKNKAIEIASRYLTVNRRNGDVLIDINEPAVRRQYAAANIDVLGNPAWKHAKPFGTAAICVIAANGLFIPEPTTWLASLAVALVCGLIASLTWTAVESIQSCTNSDDYLSTLASILRLPVDFLDDKPKVKGGCWVFSVGIYFHHAF